MGYDFTRKLPGSDSTCGGGIVVVRELSQLERRVKALLVEGQTRKTVAKTLRIKYSKVRNISDKLEYLQEIRRDPRFTNPILYFDPNSIPKGIDPPKSKEIIRYDSTYQGMIPLSDLPPSTSRVHLNGYYVCEVIRIGDVCNLYSATNNLMGYWRKNPSCPKGRTDWYGVFRIEGRDLTFCHRSGANGSETFVIWPEDVLIDGKGAIAQGSAILLDRAKFCLTLLEKCGWKFGPLKLSGRYESAHLNNPMIARMDRTENNKDAPVQADTSKETPELEVFNDSDNDILSFVPEHVRQLYARVLLVEKIQDKIISIEERKLEAKANKLEDAEGTPYVISGDYGGMYR